MNIQYTKEKVKVFLFLSVIFVLMASCNPYRVTTDYDRSLNFSHYKNFSVNTQNLQLNDIDQSRIFGEIVRQLSAKNLQQSTSPDIIINVKASHEKIKEIGQYFPYGIWGWIGPWHWGMNHTWINEYNIGSLTLDIIDRKNNKLIWQGIGSGISVDFPRQKQKEIPQIITEILKDFPPKRK